ncbi:MAG: glycoside hydrolase family 125 protein, partial [Streptococcus sp.]|nr:glycoside hydrolase family 125 protein [Streptococcus sp.]
MTIPKSVQKFMEEITELCGETHKEWAINFNHSFSNTLETTLKVHDDGTTFLLTGDIPAMWLRDSTRIGACY